MAQKLVTRAEFAELAGVSGAAITKAAAASLKEAKSGRYIDAAHPAAVEYLKNKTTTPPPPAATGLDPLYEDAIKICREADRWTANHIKKALSIGSDRATRIAAMIKATNAKAASSREEKVLSRASDSLANFADHIEQNKTPHVRGTAARREKMKAAPVEDEPLEVPDNIADYADMTVREIVAKFGTDTRFVDYLKALKSIEDIQEKRLKNEQTQGNLVQRDLIRIGIIEPLNTAHVKMMTDGAKAISVRVPAMSAAGEDNVVIEKYISGVISSFIKPVAAKVERVLKNA